MDIVSAILEICSNLVDVFINAINYKIDLSIIGLGNVSILIALSGGGLLIVLVYKFVRWLIWVYINY